LTPTEFEYERIAEPDILGGTGALLGWNSGRMHHIDLWPTEEGWVCVVDGDINAGRQTWTGSQWSISMYEVEQ